MRAKDSASAGRIEERPLVSVISPVYNEADVIEEFCQRVMKVAEEVSAKWRFEVLLVDDGSRDESLAIIKGLAQKHPIVKVLELRRNVGQTSALQAGIDFAEGEIVITLDSDLQHFPEEIPMFLEKINEGWDVVCGWRVDRQEGIMRRWPSLVANKILRKISKLPIHDIGTTFRAYRSEIIGDVLLLGENHRFIPIFASEVGAKITELPIKNIERPQGNSNYGIGRTFDVFFDMSFLFFFTRFLDRPIRLFGWLGLIMLSISMLISTVLLGMWFIEGIPVVRAHSGWFTLATILFLSSLQTILAGILMEMLIRLYYADKDKTRYHVRHVWHENGPHDR